MSLFDDRYRTIVSSTTGLFRDRGSKFIAYAYPFRDESELKARIAALKSEHPKARHHCWAYRLTPDRSVFRVNDDGEPSGTAGRPILNTLLSHDVTNVLVVVVRYFGGTLLGVPGLINAYKMATQDALANAEIIEKTVNDLYRVGFSYPQLNDVMRVVKEEDLSVIRQDFEQTCTLEFEVQQSRVNAVIGRLEKLDDTTITYLRST